MMGLFLWCLRKILVLRVLQNYDNITNRIPILLYVTAYLMFVAYKRTHLSERLIQRILKPILNDYE
jgi:hypothetical protein